jgi:hypothetical protein
MEFGVEIFYERLSRGDLRENRFGNSHTLTKSVNEFLLLLSIVLGRFG